MDQIEWPSERVPQGGLFHPPRVEYSKDTHDLIKGKRQMGVLTFTINHISVI